MDAGEDQLLGGLHPNARSGICWEAQAAIIDAHSAHPHAALWSAGATSSSDGQFFHTSDRAAGRSDVNLHYGSEPGTKFYSHLSDQYGLSQHPAD
jgi:TnpA family transposase